MNQKELLARKFRVEGIDEMVIAAFEKIRREDFIPEKDQKYAYEDSPIPILAGQTISQPSTIMVMLNALELKETDKVLEIGAGSGYNAALMGAVCKKGKVISIEYLRELANFASGNLKKAGIGNVIVIRGDGTKGYPQEAPYDKIICTAAIPRIPDEWLEQLRENGILVAPVGPEYSKKMINTQKMIKLKKTKKGNEAKDLGAFSFVPARGEYGYTI